MYLKHPKDLFKHIILFMPMISYFIFIKLTINSFILVNELKCFLRLIKRNEKYVSIVLVASIFNKICRIAIISIR